MSRMLFEKRGKAKFISHLDLMRTMQRVFARADILIKHTEGFNPHPYISFALPLSVGIESQCELVDFVLLDERHKTAIIERINDKTPSGIKILDIYDESRKFKEISWIKTEGVLSYFDGEIAEKIENLERLFSADILLTEKKTKRKITQMDIIPYIKNVNIEQVSETQLKISALMAAQNPSMSPSWLMNAIEQNSFENLPDFAAFKRLEVYDKDMTIFR